MEVFHFRSKSFIEKKKNADAAIMAIHPIKKVKAVESIVPTVSGAIAIKFSKFVIIYFDLFIQTYNFINK